MAKLNRKYSLFGLAVVALVGGAYLALKTFPHLTESGTETEVEENPNFEDLSDEELRSWLLNNKITVPEDATRESLISLARSI